mmetsp:Transcript_57865/g.188086  ORF Transcript_57865/g.188086 Transcript_57865/m.188086 type:complete len:307 (-) Transcript_57865:3397-4317(-)
MQAESCIAQAGPKQLTLRNASCPQWPNRQEQTPVLDLASQAATSTAVPPARTSSTTAPSPAPAPLPGGQRRPPGRRRSVEEGGGCQPRGLSLSRVSGGRAPASAAARAASARGRARKGRRRGHRPRTPGSAARPAVLGLEPRAQQWRSQASRRQLQRSASPTRQGTDSRARPRTRPGSDVAGSPRARGRLGTGWRQPARRAVPRPRPGRSGTTGASEASLSRSPPNREACCSKPGTPTLPRATESRPCKSRTVLPPPGPALLWSAGCRNPGVRPASHHHRRDPEPQEVPCPRPDMLRCGPVRRPKQ